MNEGDSAGGQRGSRNLALPAGLDRRSSSNTTQLSSSGSVASSLQMSRLPPLSDNKSVQQMKIIGTHQTISYQPQQQTNSVNSNLIGTSSAGLVIESSLTNENVIRTHSVVTTSVSNLSSNLFVTTSSSCNTTTTTGTGSTDQTNLLSPTSRKRLKLDVPLNNVDYDVETLKKIILEHKFLRLKNIKDKYNEHVAELFYLQSGGNMMEYPAWKKKPHNPAYINFLRSYKLEPFTTPVDELEASRNINNQSQIVTSQVAEIKIPAIGATPVAVSTQLPAAVAQLSQQGGTSITPDSSITSCERGSTLSAGGSSQSSNGTANANTSANGQEQFSVKAKQEAYVMQRVSELQRDGLWTEKRLPKLQEPPRPKAHWDYLLEEMVWLAADFAQERKWKKAAAKKCARMIQKYFQDKQVAAQKAEKAQELQLKRVAAFVSKEIKTFWANVEKLVEFKQQTKLDEKRKKALDQQLSFIVDQTEKYSQQLVEGMNKSAVGASKATSVNSSRIASPLHSRNMSDDEFRPDNESSEDDEETIAKAEAEAVGTHEEVAALKEECEMDLDEFLKNLPKGYLENRDKIVLSDHNSDSEMSDGDKEFKAEESSADDEGTIMEQEKKEKGVDHQKEIEELNADNEMSIEELMAKYKNLPKDEKMEIDSDDDSTVVDEDEDDENSKSSENEKDEKEESSEDETSADVGLKNLLDDGNKAQQAAAIAESIQPEGNTLSSTKVDTPIPFLLKHTLREYQHVGLHWLVTMHDKKLNGILADEMGLGKTIQTISLLAHLACQQGNWGPHLIIVPSSVMLNWEMEFKKWCPGFKILTYYGSQKERKIKRTGWTKPNAFHVCITSYKLVIQDHQSFRRKKWTYLILDEAQNIKNFKSQRWQLLLNFQTDQRLLLTGTPLQNNLMELWSLMHFLMPNIFQSHREFKEWFSNPMSGMIEGNMEYNKNIIERLHKVLRPFLLRRLKSEVEKQMPKKYEHVVMCRLSKRQRYLYDDFMSRAKTRETLASGNLLSVINVLMQLRKVCNHPNLFEVRPTISPFRMDGINYRTASLVYNMFDYDPFNHINLSSLNLVLIQLELILSAYVAYRSQRLITPRKLIELIDSAPEPPPNCPTGKLKLHIRIKDNRVQDNISNYSGVKVGTSPAMKTEGAKFVPFVNSFAERKPLIEVISSTTNLDDELLPSTSSKFNSRKLNINTTISAGHASQLAQSGTQIVLASSNSLLGGHLKSVGNKIHTSNNKSILFNNRNQIQNPQLSSSLASSLVQQLRHHSYPSSSSILTPEQEEKKKQTEFYLAKVEEMRKERRGQILELLGTINQKRCDANPIYGSDLRDSVVHMGQDEVDAESEMPFIVRSYSCCTNATNHPEWSLSDAIKSIERRTNEMKSDFSNFVLFVPAVCAPMPRLHVSHPHPSKISEESEMDRLLQVEVSPKLSILHPMISAMSTQFPDPRLIQYDCGKLQTLARLLKQLKSGSHRALIFTQMTRMLDVLEAFLNYHGHIYLRLDGTTKVEQRQLLMERFNEDKRIFVFILSTRSGGVGINLTGADTVIFYDSDWNPTMDAQAQDRCHRIGQTRDVNIYRLVSEKTIEENILKKANQKRLLGDLAIEGGNFTTAYFKSTTIQDLFNVDSNEESASNRLSEVIERDKERREKLQQSIASTSNAPAPVPVVVDETKSAINAFETALAAAEDDQDVQAAKCAKAEAVAELDEFDENIPIVEEATNKEPELSKAEKEVQNIIEQLSPIERYAMRFVEETEKIWTLQLQQVEAAMEQQKRDWEANRLAELKREEEEARLMEEEENDILTFSREDAKNQVWIDHNTMEKMPMWCPPTPPQDDNDIYIDYSLGFLYDQEIIPESQLPPVYVKRDYKRSRTEAGFFDGRRPLKIRKEDAYFPPRSLFDRPQVAKLRRDLKMQRHKGIFKATQYPGLKPPFMKNLTEPEGMAEWYIYEDMAMLNVIQNLQGLPLNLMLLSPGHTPNWDLVADIVNQTSRTFRSPKQCRYRYEVVIIPREEGKLLESPKKQKKNKNPTKMSAHKGARSMRTVQLYENDANSSFIKLAKMKIDNMKSAFLKRAPQVKQIIPNPSLKNPKHAAVLTKYGITNYDNPLSPTEIAAKVYERITKEKQKSGQQSVQTQDASQSQAQNQNVQQVATQSPQTQSPSQSQQVLQQQIQQIQQVAVQSPQHIQPGCIVVCGVATNTTPTVATLVQASSLQGANLQGARGSVVNICQSPNQQQQIVKAIVASPANQNLLSQQLALATAGSQQNQQVSVVLTTPVTTMSSNSGQLGQPQIVSIHQGSPQIIQTSTVVSQPTATLVQTLTPQSLPQVVSVAQLATVGTVMTTSAVQSQVATLTTSALRAQRIVAPPGSIQEVVLQQQPRTGSQSPTVVSVSGLTAQQIQQSQLQPTQVRLSVASGQQVTGVVAKGLQVATVTSGAKPINTGQIQFYRQQGGRQQIKVLHANPGTIIQTGTAVGQTVQVQQAPQKVTVVGSTAISTPTTGTAVQVAQGQPRTQYIKQVGGKQTITRQVTESEMQTLMVKRQIVGQQHKQQIITPQTQIFTPSNIQIQQAGTSGQQQIATLVKTSTGTVAATGMTLAQIKGGQIKTTMTNPNQLRQFQIQQQLLAQKKGGKMTTQITPVNKGVPTQIVVQSPKSIPPGTMTVHNIIRPGQPGTLAAGQILVGKTSVGRVIPVSVSQQSNQRQTIQVVTATSQALAAGNIRTTVTGQNIGTLKVAPGQQQQAILTTFQNQQVQRPSASPVRLQASGGSLVAVTVQQPQNIGNAQQVVTGQQSQQIQSQQQSAQQQQQAPK